MTPPFDTYRFIQRLVDAGMPHKQAEEIVLAATDASQQLATKLDLTATKQDLELSMQKLKLDIYAGVFAIVGALNAALFFALKNL